MRKILISALLAASVIPAAAEERLQAPWAKSVPASHRDRVYASEQFSNTVSVTDPVDGKLLGVIRLGDTQPANFSPLYRGQVLVHGLGFAPDGKTLAVVAIGSNSVTFIDTASNTVKHTTYVGRSPHEAFFAPDGKEVWVTVRGEDYISVIDPVTYAETARIKTPGGPGMTIFSPDGKYAYVCSSFNPLLTIFDAATHAQVGQIAQLSPFCPNIAATPDGKQVWYTLKDIGKTAVIDAHPPFATLKALDTGPITNHVNFANTPKGLFAYVTVGGINRVKVFRADNFAQVADVPVGSLPHGIWPSGDGARVFVGLENGDGLDIIDTGTNKVIGNVPIGQAPQAIAYVPEAISSGDGTQNLQPLGAAGQSVRLSLAAKDGTPRTTVTLFDQGLVQILQAAATGLKPGASYQLALCANAEGTGAIQPLSNFTANPAGAAIVTANGPIRQILNGDAADQKRWLVIREGNSQMPGAVVQVQTR
jgi:YVTN family beta-propeller protein